MRKTAGLLLLLSAGAIGSSAQGTLSGDFMMNANFYVRDSAIKASGNQLYDNYKSGGEAWLGLRYNYKGFTATLRMDAFQNSNLYSPGTPMTSFGVGAWSLSKDIGKLSLTGGYIYDQIGSGILFRSYEDRGLLIDNALVGARVKYQLTDNINVKAMVGQQKDVSQVNKLYGPLIKAIDVEGDFSIGEKIHLSPGVGALNRTMDQNSMNSVVARINTQAEDTRFVPMYNTYAFTAYNTLSAGNFSWYAEGSYKTHEAITTLDGSLLVDKPGNVEYTTLGYAQKGIAVNLTGKRTENYMMRTSPNETLIRGIMNWQPIIARLHPQRLLARYTPASQDLSEQGVNADILISPSEDFNITTDFTYINTLDNVELYREAFGEFEYRGWHKWIIDGGVQYMHYNQAIYQTVPNAPIVEATTPFMEATYKIDKKQSVRAEVEYMFTQQDYGSWYFALLEYNISPKWSFSVSDMYTTDLKPDNRDGLTKASHYYNGFIAYTKGANRFTFSYARQPAGINCTGGVCRYEPAFSGLKIGLTSSF
jgi:hypothetical protein